MKKKREGNVPKHTTHDTHRNLWKKAGLAKTSEKDVRTRGNKSKKETVEKRGRHGEEATLRKG